MSQTNSALSPEYPRVAGRYLLFEPFAHGGMASIHLGRLIGPAGFSRTVAIKRMHEAVAHNPQFVAMFLDEARLAARINHPNVVPTLDVVALKSELLLVMEYVCGESLMGLIDKCRELARPPPIPVAVDCAIGMLNGLHAAHEAKQADGRRLGIVHRDVTPHNVIIGRDGIARVVDFGIAKASGSTHQTRVGEIKGKLSYLAPEQLQGAEVSRTTDVYSAALVLWETLTCEKLFKGDTEGAIIHSVMAHSVKPPSQVRSEVPPGLDAIVMRGLDADPEKRWETAKQMAEALEAAVSPVARSVVAAWVQETACAALVERQDYLAYVEGCSMPLAAPSDRPPPLSNRWSRATSRPLPHKVSGASGVNELVAPKPLGHGARSRTILWLTGSGVGTLLAGGLLVAAFSRPRSTPAATAPSAIVADAVPTATVVKLLPPPVPAPIPEGAPATPPQATSIESDTAVPAMAPRKRTSATPAPRAGARPADPIYRRD